MRHVFVFLLSSLFGACVADSAQPSLEPADATEATGGKADNLVDVTGELVATLPVLENPRVQYNPVGGFLAVQPTASLLFSYSSCAGRDWTVTREAQPSLDGDRVLLQVTITNPIDCFGPLIKRDYDVQITADADMDRSFVLLNPSAFKITLD